MMGSAPCCSHCTNRDDHNNRRWFNKKKVPSTTTEACFISNADSQTATEIYTNAAACGFPGIRFGGRNPLDDVRCINLRKAKHEPKRTESPVRLLQ
jgi:hypothetical protein